MDISLGRQFSDGLDEFVKKLGRWTKEGRKRLIRAHKIIGQRWLAEMKKRVPRDDGTLAQRLLTNTYEENGEIITENGSNLAYAKYLEFGTQFIAGGAVKALGDSPDLTDADAIHDWPAKRAEAIKQTSASRDTSGGATGRLRNAGGQFVGGRPQEQMPWLRPSFTEIRKWAIKQIDESYEPPTA